MEPDAASKMRNTAIVMEDLPAPSGEIIKTNLVKQICTGKKGTVSEDLAAESFICRPFTSAFSTPLTHRSQDKMAASLHVTFSHSFFAFKFLCFDPSVTEMYSQMTNAALGGDELTIRQHWGI